MTRNFDLDFETNTSLSYDVVGLGDALQTFLVHGSVSTNGFPKGEVTVNQLPCAEMVYLYEFEPQTLFQLPLMTKSYVCLI